MQLTRALALLGSLAIVKPATASRRLSLAAPPYPFPNGTNSTGIANGTSPDIFQCFPYADPDCCVETVCQCSNGTFYATNEQSPSDENICEPPSNITFGDGDLPGYCCEE
ncbi:hypothetical protein GGR56DRAFT_676910 [Xylariaceae sp. FL0804]|nr:hypothetical protein GGR56DRAFT_676910 [Xylariaceae sp. FL0804]